MNVFYTDWYLNIDVFKKGNYCYGSLLKLKELFMAKLLCLMPFMKGLNY